MSRWLVAMSLAAGMVIGAGAAWFWFNHQQRQQSDSDLHTLELALNESRAALEQAHAQIDTMQGRLVVEESTRNGLEASLLASQAELGLARDKLAFFDQLMPPGPAGSVSIRALDIEPQGPILQYRVLLMRNGSDETPFKGLMQFVAKGNQQGRAVTVTLQAAQLPDSPSTAGNDAAINGFELNFDQFQRGGGFLSLPQGFTPQTVTLNVLEGNTVRVSRTVNLSAAN
ncbi:DUF6776 family protein [Pollutimonas nitritireducens]|uniref:DUF6776 family protein n=1 Tax=Pollutimonas nitritireducens TaxID=2045209 RepID=UPI001E304DCE|nr:DUF6776 family protein [Pollutimonas nitritireducens]